METRQSNVVKKTLHGDIMFCSKKSFPEGKLPTGKDVIERILHQKNWTKPTTASQIAQELIDQWIWCNVYTLSHKRVTQKIVTLVATFAKLSRYPNNKKGKKIFMDLTSFTNDIEKLFDIFCENPTQRRHLEVEYKLRMTDNDYSFYEDQKGPRAAKCTKVITPLDESDYLFARRHDNPTATQHQSQTDVSPLSSSVLESENESNRSESGSSAFGFEQPCSSNKQNRISYPNLARICDRYQVSDRAGAAIATSVLKDHGIVSSKDSTFVVDKNKLRRERERQRKVIQKEEQQTIHLINGFYIDGRKDATLMTKEINGRYHRHVELEEHYVIVGEPGEFYLSHVAPTSGSGSAIAQSVFNFLKDSLLYDKLAIIGSDGTASMTGAKKGAIRCLEELLQRPLQWAICLLHCNELPLRHIFKTLDGTTKSPSSFSGPIGKELSGSVTEWDVVKFKPIPNSDFPVLPPLLLDSLSTDQFYAYNICWEIIQGNNETDIQFLEIGELCHSRWLTLGCRLLRKYISEKKPSKNLKILAEYCIQVYFPSWFEIKHLCSISDGAKNFFNLIQRHLVFPYPNVLDIAKLTLQRNAFFSHPENIMLSMLGDSNLEIRKLAINNIKVLRSEKRVARPMVEDYLAQPDDEEDDCVKDIQQTIEAEPLTSANVRQFLVPKLDFNAKSYYQLVPLDQLRMCEPPAIRDLTDQQLDNILEQPLRLSQPCHNQAVERHVKLVTEASSTVVGYHRRDGLIRQKVRSHKLMPAFDNKKQFPLE